MLKLHDFNISGYKVQSIKVGFPDHFPDRAAMFIISQGGVNGLVLTNVKLGLSTDIADIDACGSRSIVRTRYPWRARKCARWTLVVVLALPPLKLATAKTGDVRRRVDGAGLTPRH